MSRSRRPYFSLASTTIERPSGVSSASEASCAASASSRSVTPRTGRNSVAWRLPRVMVPVLSRRSVSTSPAASTARPDMASTLKRTSRSMPAMPMAESSAPIVVGISVTKSATSAITPIVAAGIGGEARDRGDGEDEDDGQPDEQDVERDLVRRLLPLRALDQRDHPVEERVPARRGDADDQPVGDHLRAAGHGRAVAAGLADDRRGFAGDRRLVDRGDALDHLAVAGDDVAGLDQDEVARPRGPRPQPPRRARDRRRRAAASRAWWSRVARRASACALPRPSAIASAKLAKSSVNQSQRMIWKLKPRWPAPVARSRRKRTVVRSATTSTTNITGLRIICRGSSLREGRAAGAGTTICGREQGSLVVWT